MKNQQTKILLGVCLIAIWGLLGFRISSKLSGNQQYTLLEPATLDHKVIIHPFTFELDLNYNDPFGKPARWSQAQPKSILAHSGKKENLISLIHKKKIIPTFPRVEYRGDITSKTGRKAAVLKVEKDFINLGIGETFADIQLIAIYPDSVHIVFQSYDKVIPKVKE